MLWSQRQNSGAHGAENSIQISALNLKPWHLAAADVATRLPCTHPFSRLLRHAGGYSRTILTPNLQGLDFYYKKKLKGIILREILKLYFAFRSTHIYVPLGGYKNLINSFARSHLSAHTLELLYIFSFSVHTPMHD